MRPSAEARPAPAAAGGAGRRRRLVRFSVMVGSFCAEIGAGVGARKEGGRLGHRRPGREPAPFEIGRDAESRAGRPKASKIRRDVAGRKGDSIAAAAAHALGGRVEDAGEARRRALFLAHLPGLARHDVAVDLGQQAPDAISSARLKAKLLHRRAPLGQRPLEAPPHLVVVAHLSGGTPPKDWRQSAATRETVLPRSLARSALYRDEEGLVGEARVLAEGHLAQEEVAQRVGPKRVDERVGPHDVADGLRHLLRVAQPPAVRPDRSSAAAGPADSRNAGQ